MDESFVSLLNSNNRRSISDIRQVHTTVTEFHITSGSDPEPIKTVQHFRFAELLTLCVTKHLGAHNNVLMIGPKGTMKTTAAREVAKVLKRPFFYHSAIKEEYKLKGFIDGAGRYHETQYYKALGQPSVLLLDEIDASSPDALLSINTDLANRVADFPTGCLNVHPECLILGASNTNLKGATSEYTGRSTQDSALRDRFIKFSWPLDEQLESYYSHEFAHWSLVVQYVRQRLDGFGMEFISPRATFAGVSIFRACVNTEAFQYAWDLAVESTMLHDYDPDVIQSILSEQNCLDLRRELEIVYEELAK